MKRAFLAALMVATAACSVGLRGPASYVVSAEFPSTIGLYPGSFVRQLGINVGTVSNVENQADHVLVIMKIRDKYRLSPNAQAILVGDSVLGERYVQFEPAYTGGPPLPRGTTLGPDRVTVPVETDAVLRSLNSVLRQIDPNDVRQFTVNLASILQGEGAKLNNLIANAAGTLQVLADKGNDLGRLNGTLAALTAQLGTKDRALARLVQDYDLLSQTIAADRGQLDGTITQLTNLTTQGAGLLGSNLDPIRADVADLTTVGQTLDRNLPAVDIGLQYATRLFSAASNAYDPLHNWLPLNSQANQGATGEALAPSIRDALASLCRRLAAKQPALAPAFAQCGDPNSGFFDPVLGLLPTLLKAIPGQTARPATAQAAFKKGLAAIPALSPDQRQTLVASVADPAPQATAGPPGAAAVAALRAVPIETPTAHTRHRGGLWHWLASLL